MNPPERHSLTHTFTGIHTHARKSAGISSSKSHFSWLKQRSPCIFQLKQQTVLLLRRQTVNIADNGAHEVTNKSWKNVIVSLSPSLSQYLQPHQCMTALFLLTVSLCLVDTHFHGIQNDTRHSGSLIKCYRKAILAKVTCFALHQVTVMSILKPKQRQVTLVLLFGSVCIIETTSISVRTQKQENKNVRKKPVERKVSTNTQLKSRNITNIKSKFIRGWQ